MVDPGLCVIVDSTLAIRWFVGEDFLNFWIIWYLLLFDFAERISLTTTGLCLRQIVHKICFIWLIYKGGVSVNDLYL